MQQLVESKNTATSLKADLSKEDKEAYKKEIKASTSIIKQIDTLIAMYLGTVDKRQGITRNPAITVNQRFRQASSYIRSRFGEQTTTETILMQQFKVEFIKALRETNTFYNKEWPAYKLETENIKISPFKKTKIYALD